MILAVFVLPIALYCFLLGLVNRRRSPLVVPGAWDFAGLLVAASGLLILGGPAVLTGLSERWRMFWLAGRARGEDLAGDAVEGLWPVLAGLYFLVVVAGAALVLWRRRRHTAVYNVEADVFQEVFAAVLDEQALVWTRVGDRYLLSQPPKEPAASPLPSPAPPIAAGEWPGTVVTVDLAPALRHATLRWDGRDSELRAQVERELVKILQQVRTRSNPAGAWLLLSSAFLLGFALMGVTAMVLARTLAR